MGDIRAPEGNHTVTDPNAPEQPAGVPPVPPQPAPPAAPAYGAPQQPAPPAAPAYGAPQAPAYGAPAYGAPQQPGYVQPAYGAPAPGAKTNVLAIVSLVSAFFISLVAVITGHIALSQIKKTGEQGRGLAIAGLVIGYIGLVTGLIWILVIIVIAVSGGFTYSTTTY